MVNCVPRPTSLCKVMCPPWASMIFRVVGSPRPESLYIFSIFLFERKLSVQ